MANDPQTSKWPRFAAATSAQTDPFAAIEATIPGEQFTASVAQAEKLSRDEAFDPWPCCQSLSQLWKRGGHESGLLSLDIE